MMPPLIAVHSDARAILTLTRHVGCHTPPIALLVPGRLHKWGGFVESLDLALFVFEERQLNGDSIEGP